MLFHARTYEDPAHASNTHHLPCVEVWSPDGKAWYVRYGLPGCLADSEELKFNCVTSAIKEAYGYADLDWDILFRHAYQGALARLRGSIDLALAEEKALEALAQELDVVDSDGLAHVEELAHEVARVRFTVSQ